MFFSRLDEVLALHILFLIVEDLAVGQTDEEVLFDLCVAIS